MNAPAPTRAAGISRLDAFAPLAGSHYATDRNYDRGSNQHTGVSGLSPYIRHRLVSETEVLRAVLSQHTPAAADKFIQEVFWRSYWKGWLEQRPSVWFGYLQQVASMSAVLTQDTRLAERYSQVIEGRTAIEPMNSWTNELVTTGYLHNHARMWFASIWIFTLKLPWVLGADFFLRHLLDGDPASNTLSWRWVAGLHTKGKTYLATQANIEKYAGDRFFSGGQPEGLNLLADQATAIDEGSLLPARAPVFPKPVAIGDVAGLLLTEDDLHLEMPGQPIALAAWIPEASASGARAPVMPTSELVSAFKHDAAQDALSRAELKWPTASKGSLLTTLPAIVDWVKREKLTMVYAATTPVGYPGMQTAKLAATLADIDCQLHFVARDYDRCVWPHANKGFFKLKKQIPALLESLGLTDPAS